MSLALTLLFLPLITSSYINSFYSNCQKSSEYGCFISSKEIENCVQTKNCDFGATWIGESENSYKIQLISTIGDFVAIGFNPTISSMGPAPVLACSQAFPDLPDVYYNQPNFNGAPAFSYSTMVSNYQISVEDGVTSCEFSLNSIFSISPTENSEVETYDLNKNPSFLIMAVGDLFNNMILSHSQKEKTEIKIDLTVHNQYYNPNEVSKFYTNCQNSEEYGCFVSSDNVDKCSETKNCDFGATWIGESENSYKIQLISTIGDFVAIGFNFESSSMGPAPALACSQSFADHPDVYFNQANYASAPAYQHSDMTSNYHVTFEDGVTSCEFSLNSSFFITPTLDAAVKDYNLNENPTYIIMAVGDLFSNMILLHTKKDKTGSTVDLTDHNEFYSKNDTGTNQAIYDKCYEEKGCFGTPDYCVDKRNCDMLVTYTSLVGTNLFKFELQGKTDESYTAVGLSNDKNMGDDSVMVCLHNSNNMPVQMYWNSQKPKNSVPLEDPSYGLSDVSWKNEDGLVTCTFSRESFTDVEVPNQNRSVKFDLVNSTFYLLMARGPVFEERSGIIGRHTSIGWTGEEVNLGDFNQVAGDKGTLIKLHASFMVLSWLLFANLGTFVARYCKNIFMNKQIKGADVWFRIHQTCMTLCVLLCVAGVIPVIIDKKLKPIADEKLHPLLGLTVLIIAFLQPIIAFFRPGKDAKLRPLFKFVHASLGYSAVVLSLISIYFTNELETQYLPDWGFYLLYAFGGWFLLSHCLMTGYLCIKDEDDKDGADQLIRIGLNIFAVVSIGLVVALISSVALK